MSLVSRGCQPDVLGTSSSVGRWAHVVDERVDVDVTEIRIGHGHASIHPSDDGGLAPSTLSRTWAPPTVGLMRWR